MQKQKNLYCLGNKHRRNIKGHVIMQ